MFSEDGKQALQKTLILSRSIMIGGYKRANCIISYMSIVLDYRSKSRLGSKGK